MGVHMHSSVDDAGSGPSRTEAGPFLAKGLPFGSLVALFWVDGG